MLPNCLLYLTTDHVQVPVPNNLHDYGHEVGDELKSISPLLYTSLGMLFHNSRVSELAKVNVDEAFAEGFVLAVKDPSNTNGGLLLQTVSRLLDADPLGMVRQLVAARP